MPKDNITTTCGDGRFYWFHHEKGSPGEGTQGTWQATGAATMYTAVLFIMRIDLVVAMHCSINRPFFLIYDDEMRLLIVM
mmetsp:Transcript_31627/g.54633  ORF Transcript_31627/g.54633 Transcript_31627/m.54633 type:complete len:80 (+) Transcript_31627:229-468(+)